MGKRKRVKEDAVIFVMFEDGEASFFDNEGNRSERGKQEKFETKASGKGKGKVFWYAAKGVDTIDDIKVVEGAEIFKSLPEQKNDETWAARMDKREEGEAKYDIEFTTEDGDKVKVDPLIRVQL